MSYLKGKCGACNNEVVFDEQPYQYPEATMYWKSTYDKNSEHLFFIERKIPSVNKKGKVVVTVVKEYIQQIYCSLECGLKEYERTTV